MRKNIKNLGKKLLKRALKLLRAGFSVIPVRGNYSPDQPKKPAIKWRPFQRRLATEAEINASFSGKVGALGIVCGRVSKLVVIDFDDHLRYQRFCRHLPQYAATYTVKTRRGYHLYFRTIEKVPSHQFDGGDIKGERSYVLAPPSRIGDFAYAVVKDIAVLALDKDDVDRLLNYFHVNASAHVAPAPLMPQKKELDMARLYRRLAPQLGRNNALYRAASAARAHGTKQEAVELTLLPLHINMPAQQAHKQETVEARLREGQLTIESAYRGAAQNLAGAGGLPNSVRERLLREQKSTIVARLLELMFLAGWQAESYFTLKDAITLGAGQGLGRKSVLQALTGELSIFDGRHIIARRYVEYLDIRGLKSGKRGRPIELVFQVPAIGRLLAVLNVALSPSDSITIDDVKSARSYRVALHREYIQRLKPKASIAALAGRIGLNERSIRRYNQALGVKKTERIGSLKLTRQNLASLPKRRRNVKKNATPGYWLERGQGLRFPAWRHIGAKLLKQKDLPATVCLRLPSVWSLGTESVARVCHERITAAEFLRLRALRAGAPAEEGGILAKLKDMLGALRKQAPTLRYEKVRLYFDSVASRIASDKIAETIKGYVYAIDADGEQVRRPARRGVAYRMLKEFGDGNVFLALQEGYSETVFGSNAAQA